MPASGGPTAAASARTGVWRASADVTVATIAGGLVLLLFYPLTVCAAGVKRLVRTVRRRPVSHGGRDSVTSQ
jgi:hypothetical protein